MDIQASLPLAFEPFQAGTKKIGLVIVDIVNGFASVGAGALAPAAPNAQVDQMIFRANQLAREFLDRQAPVLAFLDSHVPGRPEPPYPPHCEIGTGEENLVPALTWLEGKDNVTLMRKDCINGFIGGFDLTTGRNVIIDWIAQHQLTDLVVLGICTDICVMDFVLTLLSARNHAMTSPLQDIWVYEPGCATYDLPAEVAASLGLPATSTHPQMLTHHLGLYMMASRGAKLTQDIVF